MPIPLWAAKIGGEVIGGVIGKTLSKVADWVPSPRQYRRKQIRKLKDEIKKLEETLTLTNRARIVILTHRLSEFENQLTEE